jgi:zinc transport system substrate-binding protein
VVADRLTVVASVFPLYDFAREVAAPEADVWLLLPAGVEPHTWEPTPADIVRLSTADIFFTVGRTMEPWSAKVLKAISRKDLKLFEAMSVVGAAFPGPPGEDDHIDPHVWLDLAQAARIVEMMGVFLAEASPASADLYREKAGNYAAKLGNLDKAYMDGLEHCSTRTIVTGGHAAFGHLAQRYGLTQVPLYGISPDAEPSPRHLIQVIKQIREKGIETIFSEEMVNPRLAQVLSEETGARLLVLNPSGNLTAAQWQSGTTFLDLMELNLKSLREGLHCE